MTDMNRLSLVSSKERTMLLDRNQLVTLYTDATTRSTAFYIVTDDFTEAVARKLPGVLTVNQAEYSAMVEGLRKCLDNGAKVVDVYSDSQLMVRQLQGTYKVKAKDIWPFYKHVKELESKFEKVCYTHIRGIDNPADVYSREILHGSANSTYERRLTKEERPSE
jgi:ribonuclease HI